jgi:hypothetical protein
MSVKSVPGINVVSSAPKMPASQPKAKVNIVKEDTFPARHEFKPLTRNVTVYNLKAIPETDEALESPPQAPIPENLHPQAPNPNRGLALRKLAALKEAEARNNFK